jgi:hypothetical protein
VPFPHFTACAVQRLRGGIYVFGSLKTIKSGRPKEREAEKCAGFSPIHFTTVGDSTDLDPLALLLLAQQLFQREGSQPSR